MENNRQSDDALTSATVGKGSEEAFQTILSFAGRATTLAHRQAGSAGANALFADVVRFCRNKPDYSVLLEPYRRTSEFAQFIALLKIIRHTARRVGKALMKMDRSADTDDSGLTKLVAQNLAGQYGIPRTYEAMYRDLTATDSVAERVALPEMILATIEAERIFRENGLRLEMDSSRWIDSGCCLSDPRASLSNYDRCLLRTRRERGLPNIDPLARRRAGPSRTELPPRDPVAIETVRAEALRRAQTVQEEVSEMPRKRTLFCMGTLLPSTIFVDRLQDQDVVQYLRAVDRHLRRILVTLRRAQQNTFKCLEMADAIRSLIETENMPPRVGKIAGIESILEIFRAYVELLEYVGMDHLMPDYEPSRQSREMLLGFLGVELEEKLATNVRRAAPEDEEAGPEASVSDLRDAFRDSANMDGMADWSTIPDGAQFGRIQRYVEELEGDIHPSALDTAEDRQSPAARARRLPFKPLFRAALGMFYKGGLMDKVIGAMRNMHIGPRDALALKSFLLHLCRAVADVQIPGYKKLREAQTAVNPNGNPLIPSKPALDIRNFHRKIEAEEMPPDLWDQQQEVLIAVKRALDKGLTGMFFVAPPGSGKTRIMVTLASELNPNGRTLILVPTIQLARQTEESVRRFSDIKDVGVVAGNSAFFDAQVVIATYQSFQKFALAGLFDPCEFGLVELDEAHKSLSDQRMFVRDAFPQAILVGATATSTDVGNRNIDGELKKIYDFSTLDGMKAGIVNPMRLWVYTTTGGWKDKANYIRRFAARTCQGDKALVVFDSISRIETASAHLREKGGVDVQCVHSKIDDENPGRILALETAFLKGEIPMLLVCEMLVEGFDDPDLRYGILADVPTTEWQLLQAIGRLSRRKEGKGDSGLVLLVDQDTDREKLKTVMEHAFGVNPFTHVNGQRMVQPKEDHWPKKTILV